VVQSGSVSYGTAAPYLPLIDLLKTYFQIDARDDGQKIREKMTGKLLTLDETLRPLLPALLALLDVSVEDREWQSLEPAERWRHTHEAIRRLLLRESQRQPPMPGLRGSALDRRRNPDGTRWPGGEPARRPPPAPRELPPGVSPLLG
jgi:hypothetical protein